MNRTGVELHHGQPSRHPIVKFHVSIEFRQIHRNLFPMTDPTHELFADKAATMCARPVGTIRSRVARGRTYPLDAIRSADEQTG